MDAGNLCSFCQEEQQYRVPNKVPISEIHSDADQDAVN